MSGPLSNTSVSAIINDAAQFNTIEKSALCKAYRTLSGMYKVATDTATNSTVLVPVSEISFAVKAGARYIMYIDAITPSVAAAGLKFQVNASSGNTSATFSGYASLTGATASGGATLAAINSPTNLALTPAGLGLFAIAYFVPLVDDLVTFSFAQQTATAGNTTVGPGSNFLMTCLSGSRRAPNTI